MTIFTLTQITSGNRRRRSMKTRRRDGKLVNEMGSPVVPKHKSACCDDHLVFTSSVPKPLSPDDVVVPINGRPYYQRFTCANCGAEYANEKK